MKHHLTYVVATMVGVGGLLTAAAPVAAASSAPLSCSHAVASGQVHCDAEMVAAAPNIPLISAAPSGYGPAQFHAAYGVPTAGSKPVTVAVVAAYHDPTIAADLRTYDAAYKLPDPPKLQQLNQRGTSSFPAVDAGWALEESMDVETIHEMCQNCSLVLVEADSASTSDLMAAIDMAASKGATVISNSWGGAESSNDGRLNSHFQHAGVTVVASAGDEGYGWSFRRLHQRWLLRVGPHCEQRRRVVVPVRWPGPMVVVAAVSLRLSQSGSATRAALDGRWPTLQLTPTPPPGPLSTIAPAIRGVGGGLC